MAYQISIISGSKEQSLTLDAVMAAVAPPNDLGLVPGKTAGRILVKRAGGLETELFGQTASVCSTPPNPKPMWWRR